MTDLPHPVARLLDAANSHDGDAYFTFRLRDDLVSRMTIRQ
jgi:hypothetical protein